MPAGRKRNTKTKSRAILNHRRYDAKKRKKNDISSIVQDEEREDACVVVENCKSINKCIVYLYTQ